MRLSISRRKNPAEESATACGSRSLLGALVRSFYTRRGNREHGLHRQFGRLFWANSAAPFVRSLPAMPPNTAALSIRSANLADLPTIVDFNCRLAWETEHKRLDQETINRGVRRALTQPQMCRYFVAESVGQVVVGQAMVTFELTDWRDGVLWWFQSVYVRDTHRGRGVFHALFDHILSLAQVDSDVRGLRLY